MVQKYFAETFELLEVLEDLPSPIRVPNFHIFLFYMVMRCHRHSHTCKKKIKKTYTQKMHAHHQCLVGQTVKILSLILLTVYTALSVACILNFIMQNFRGANISSSDSGP